MKYVLIKYNERTAGNGQRLNVADWVKNEFDASGIKTMVWDCSDIEDLLRCAQRANQTKRIKQCQPRQTW